MFILLTGFTSASFGVMGLAQQTGTPPDPFAAYADILPRQPESAVVARGFPCHSYGYVYHRSQDLKACVAHFTADAFSLIQVSTVHGFIERTDFTIRDDALRLGDLTLLMGTSYKHDVRSMVRFFWQGKLVLARTSVEHNSPHSPVRQVTFTRISKDFSTMLP